MDFKPEIKYCHACGKIISKSICLCCGYVDIRFFSEFAKPLLAAGEIAFPYSPDSTNFNCLGREVKGRVKLIFLQRKKGVTTPMIRMYTKGKFENISLLKVKITPGHPLEPLLKFVKQQNFSKPAPIIYSSSVDEEDERQFLLEKEKLNKTSNFQPATLQQVAQ